MAKKFLEALCDLIYPPVCILCKRLISAEEKDISLCLSCQNTIEKNLPPFCQKCSRHLEESLNGDLCHQCTRTPYHFDRVWATTVYNKTLTRLIHRFKYQNKTVLRKIFSKLIFSFIKDYHIDLSTFDFIVPIPLHPTRLRERGFNQAQLLAESLANELPATLLINQLLRTHYTRNQALLGKKERWTNIQGAFTIKGSLEFKGKNVLLIDDLFTTGTTISEAARILKENGANNVSALTLAIAN